MRRRADTHISVDERLIDMEERNQGLSWPLAVDLWLEQRVQQARDAGVLTTRKELSAALMTDADPSDDALVALIINYRRRTAGDLLGERDPEKVIEFRRQGPGPRPRRTQP